MFALIMFLTSRSSPLFFEHEYGSIIHASIVLIGQNPNNPHDGGLECRTLGVRDQFPQARILSVDSFESSMRCLLVVSAMDCCSTCTFNCHLLNMHHCSLPDVGDIWVQARL